MSPWTDSRQSLGGWLMVSRVFTSQDPLPRKRSQQREDRDRQEHQHERLRNHRPEASARQPERLLQVALEHLTEHEADDQQRWRHADQTHGITEHAES